MPYVLNRDPDITYSTKRRFKESNPKTMQPDESDLRRGEIHRRIEETKYLSASKPRATSTLGAKNWRTNCCFLPR